LDKCYTNDHLALDWLKNFKRYSKLHESDSYLLLLLEGHGSHIIDIFALFYQQHKILFFSYLLIPPTFSSPLTLFTFSPISTNMQRQLMKPQELAAGTSIKLNFLLL
jgi:hypothetical protein